MEDSSSNIAIWLTIGCVGTLLVLWCIAVIMNKTHPQFSNSKRPPNSFHANTTTSSQKKDKNKTPDGFLFLLPFLLSGLGAISFARNNYILFIICLVLLIPFLAKTTMQKPVNKDSLFNLWTITGCMAFCCNVAFFGTLNPLFLLGNITLLIPLGFIWRKKSFSHVGYRETVDTLNMIESEFKDSLVFPPIKKKLIQYARIDLNKGDFKLDSRCSDYKEMTYILVQQEAQGNLKLHEKDSLNYIRSLELIAYVNNKLGNSK